MERKTHSTPFPYCQRVLLLLFLQVQLTLAGIVHLSVPAMMLGLLAVGSENKLMAVDSTVMEGGCEPDSCRVPIDGWQIFIRDKATPYVEKHTFKVPDASLVYTLTVKNGDPPITSADIFVNGVQLFRERDFNPKVQCLSAKFSAKADNSIEVRLRGKPTSYLSVMVSLVDERPLSVAFEKTALSGLESVAQPAINLVLSRAAYSPVEVTYEIMGGTATEGVDFVRVEPKTVAFAAGVVKAGIPLTVVCDSQYEGDETVIFGIRSGTCGAVPAAGTCTYTIQEPLRAVPAIIWNDPTPITYGVGLSSVQLNATSVVAGSWVYQPGAGTVLSVGRQRLSVTLNPTDLVRYAPATKEVYLQVNKAVPTIAWSDPVAIIYGTQLSSAQLNATGSVPGALTYTPSLGSVLSVGTQTLTVRLDPTDSTNYSSSTKTVSLVVTKAPTSIAWSNPSSIVYGTALSSTQLNAVGSVPGTLTYTPSLGAQLSVGTQSLSVRFDPTDSVNFSSSTKTVSLVVTKAPTSITWSNPSSIVYGTGLSATQLNAAGSAPGTLTYTPSLGSVLSAGTQTLSVRLDPTDSANFATSTKTVSLAVTKALTSITWSDPASIVYGTALTSTQLNAAGSVSGTLTYTPSLGSALSAGTQTLTVRLDPTDSVNFSSSTKTVSLAVTKAPTSITWSDPSSIVYGTALTSTQLNAAGSVPGALTYTPPLGAQLSVGTQSLSVRLDPTDSVNYSSSTKTVSLAVTKAPTSVTWSDPSSIVYGTVLSSTQLNAVGAVPGALTYTPPLDSMLAAGAQTLSVRLDPTDSANYSTSTKSVSLVVTKAPTSITWSDPSSIVYGTALSLTQLNAVGSVPGALTYTPSLGSVLSAGTQTLTVHLDPTDSANFIGSTKSVLLVVTKAPTSVTWSDPSSIVYGTVLSATQLNAVGSIPGALTYTPSLGSVLSAGTQTLRVSLDPTDSVNYSSSTKTVTLAVTKAPTSITWSDPASVVYGTALSSTQLNAVGSVPGALTYTPPLDSMLSAGSQTLSVRLDPTDSVNFSSSTKTVSLAVTKAPTSVTWSDPSSIVYGTALTATQLNAAGSVPGTLTYTPSLGAQLSVGTQGLSVRLDPTDSANYSSSTMAVSLVVTKAPTSITWSDPASVVYGTALSSTQLNAVGSVPGALTYTPPLDSMLSAGAQTLSVHLDPMDSANFSSSTKTVSLAVIKAPTSVTWSDPSSIVYGTALSATQLNAAGSIPGTLTYTPSLGSVLSAGTQTLSVHLDPTDSVNYSSSTKTVSLAVTKAPTSVTWSDPVSIVYGTVLSSTQLNAVGSVPGALTFTPSLGSALSAGTQTLTVHLDPTDSANFIGSTKTVSLVVTKAPTSIAWSDPSSIVYGTALTATQLNAVGSVTGTLTYIPSLGSALSAGTQTLSVSLDPTDNVNFSSSTKTVSLAVTKASTSITWSDPSSIVYGMALSSTQLNAVGSVPGTLTYTPSLGSALSAGAQTLSVHLDPTDSANYSTSTKSVSLVVAKAPTSIAWSDPVSIVYGMALSSTQLNAVGSVPGTLTYTPETGVVLPAGEHALAVAFMPTDTVNYTELNSSVSLTVQRAVPTVTWAQPAAITYGTALNAEQLTATASTIGSFAFAPAAGAILPAGDHTLAVTFTPADVANFVPVTASVALTVRKAVPNLTWAAPSAITYGTALDATQLAAIADTPGTIVYAPAADTVLPAGERVLSAVFTPADVANYTDAQATIAITVKKAVPVLTWATPKAVSYGTTLSNVQCTATSSVEGSFDYTPGLGTLLPAGTHTLRATFTPTDLANYVDGGEITAAQVVSKAQPTITWSVSSPLTTVQPLSNAQLNAVPSVPGVLTYEPVAGTVLTAGDHPLRVHLDPEDATNYATAEAETMVRVVATGPSLRWADPAPITYGLALSDLQLNAVASVPGTYRYTPAAGTVLSAGLHLLTVIFTPEDAAAGGALTTSVRLSVQRLPAQVTWAVPEPITYGTALGVIQLNAVASHPGRLSYTPVSGTRLTAGDHELTVVLTPTDAVNIQGATAKVTLRVRPADPVLSWPTPSAIPAGQALGATECRAVSSVPGVFIYTPDLGTILSAGQHRLMAVFTPEDRENYVSGGTVRADLAVIRRRPAITWEPPFDIIYGTQLSSLQLRAVADAPGSLRYEPPVGSILPAGSHRLAVIFTADDPLSIESDVRAEVSLVVLRATPRLTWGDPAPVPFGTQLSNLQLQATADFSGHVEYAPAAGAVLPVGTHLLRAEFTPEDPANVNRAETQVSLRVEATPVCVTWADPEPISYGTKLDGRQLNAIGSVPGQLVYEPPLETLLAAGWHSLQVTLIPDDSRLSPVHAQVRLQVRRSVPALSWTDPDPAPYGTRLGTTQLCATASVPGTFTYNLPAGTLLDGGEHALTTTFTPDDTDNFSADATMQVRWRITPIAATITWTDPAPIPFGQRLGGDQLSARVDVPGELRYEPAAGVALYAGEHLLRVAFFPANPANYLPAAAERRLTVVKAAPVLSWSDPAAYRYPQVLLASRLNASTSVRGTFTYSPSAGTALPPGVHSLRVVFQPDDADNYLPVDASRTVTVLRGLPTITWVEPAPLLVANALAEDQLSASGSVPGILVYDPPLGTLLPLGDHTLAVTLRPEVAELWEETRATVPLTVIPRIPIVTWRTPEALTYGQVLGQAQLNATCPMPGTFAYDPPAGTLLNAGSHTLHVTFTPQAVYQAEPVQTSITLLVKRAKPTIRWATPAPIASTTPLSDDQLNADAHATVRDQQQMVSGVFTYTPPAGTFLLAGTHLLHVSLAPADAVNFETVEEVVTLVVLDPPKPEDFVDVDMDGIPDSMDDSITLTDGDSSGGGSGSGSGGGGGGGGGGSGSGSGSSYGSGSGHKFVEPTISVVFKKRPAIVWEPLAPIRYGTSLTDQQLSAAAQVAGSFTYLRPIDGNWVACPVGTALEPGIYRLRAVFTPSDRSRYISVTSEVPLRVERERPPVTWIPRTPIPRGSVIDDQQLNLTAPIAGKVTYSLPPGTVLLQGLVITATFEPNNSTRFETVTLTRRVDPAPDHLLTPVVTATHLTSTRWQHGDVLTQADFEELVRDPLRPTLEVPGRFVSPDVGRTLVPGGQIVHLEFYPQDEAVYAPVVLDLDLTVFERSDAPRWLGTSAAASDGNLASITDFGAALVSSGTATPAVRLTWNALSAPAATIDVLRLQEVEITPAVDGYAWNRRTILPTAGGIDAFPWWVPASGTTRIARTPQWVTIATLPASATEFIDHDLVCSTWRGATELVRQRALYRLRVRDGAGASRVGPSGRIELPFERPIPVGPQNLTVTREQPERDAEGVETDVFRLSWTAPAETDGIAAYEIYMASAVEHSYNDNIDPELRRAGITDDRYHWIRVGHTTATTFVHRDDQHPDLLWSQHFRFANPEFPVAANNVLMYTDPWTVEHCQPSYLFKVVAVGAGGQPISAAQASRTVTIDGDRRSLLRPRFSGRMNLAASRLDAPQWSHQDLDVVADDTGSVRIRWSPIIYDCSVPLHLVDGATEVQGLMDWGRHTAVLLCDGIEVGTYPFNTRLAAQPLAFTHVPGVGRHTYAVRITNYAKLTCTSGPVEVQVGGAAPTTDSDRLTPANLSCDRTATDSWLVTWTPSIPAVAGNRFVVLVDGTVIGTATVGALRFSAPSSDVLRSITVEQRSADDVLLGTSLPLPVPAVRPSADAPMVTVPPIPGLRAVSLEAVTLRWGFPGVPDADRYDLERDGRVVAHLGRRGEFRDLLAHTAASHTYRLRAVAADGRLSAWSPVLTVRMPPDQDPPSAVQGLEAHLDTREGGVALTWNGSPAVERVASWQVFRDGVLFTAVTTPTYRDSTPPGGRVVTYGVAAVDESGNASTLGSGVHITVPDRPVPVPLSPEAYLVSRLLALDYPVGTDDSRHLDHGVEVTWMPMDGEGGSAADIAAYRVYRQGILQSEIPISVLIRDPLRPLTAGALLTRAELLLRNGGYFDLRRRRNVWVDTRPLPIAEEVRYTITAITTGGRESQPTAPIAVQVPDQRAPRRPEILRVRDRTARAATLEVHAWPLERADPYHNSDFTVAHGPGSSGWPAARWEGGLDLLACAMDAQNRPLRRDWLDDRRLGRLLTTDHFGGGDNGWGPKGYGQPAALTRVDLREPGNGFVGSGSDAWVGGVYADVDLLVDLDGVRSPVPWQVMPGIDLDGRPCRIQVIHLDGLQPAVDHQVRIVARTVAGYESISPPWTLRTTPADPGDGFEFTQAPRFVGPASPYPGSVALTARAITADGTEDGITYQWRHLTETGSFSRNESAAARDTVFTPTSWSSSWFGRVQTIRCYAIYRGRAKYLDINLALPKPTISFDPSSLPVYPARTPETP